MQYFIAAFFLNCQQKNEIKINIHNVFTKKLILSDVPILMGISTRDTLFIIGYNIRHFQS